MLLPMAFEAPGWAAQPTSSLVLRAETEGKVWHLDQKPAIVIGRNADLVDIHLDFPKLSRLHAAVIHHQNGNSYLVDLASENGTFVRGQQIAVHTPVKVAAGDTVHFGGTNQLFSFQAVYAKGIIMYRASHLLVKHKDVRRPSSWKEDVVTRSEGEALEMIEGFRQQLIQGDPATLPHRFSELSKQESHCSSAKRGGDLGDSATLLCLLSTKQTIDKIQVYRSGAMMPAFEEATAALHVGDLSEPVFTASGVHLILRTG